MEIYVLINNQQHGPYTPELIRQYLESKQLQPTDLAAYAGGSEWTPLSAMVQSWEADPPKQGTRFSPGGAPATKASALRKGLTIAAVALVLVAGAGGVAWWWLVGDHGPNITVTTTLEAGLPNTLAELNSWYAQPPEAQNAAAACLKGFEAMQVTEADRNSKDLPLLGKGQLPAMGSPLSPNTKAAIKSVVERNKAAREALQQATKFEQSRYPIDLSRGLDTPLPHLVKIRQACLLEELAAWMQTDAKQPPAAVDTLMASLAIAQSLKYEPLTISQLARAADLTIQGRALEAVVNAVALPPAELGRLSAALARAEAEESAGEPFTRALAGERVSTLAFMDLPSDQMAAALKKMNSAKPYQPGGPSPGAMLSHGMKFVRRNLKSQRAFAEQSFNQALLLRKQPFPERLKVDDYLTSRIDEATTNQFWLVVMMNASLAAQSKREAAALAQLRLAQTAIALERYRAANMKYPATLKELSPQFLPAVPQDPFDGAGLRYKTDGAGYELQSIGADKTKPITFKVLKQPKAAPKNAAGSAAAAS
jgi:hypothetical protein